MKRAGDRLRLAMTLIFFIVFEIVRRPVKIINTITHILL
jgi:hypothetical protein